MPVSKKHLAELYQLFAAIENDDEARRLLTDILTPQELESIAERWQLIKQLHAGKPQRNIAEDLGISISKISKGSRVLQYGEGGFDIFLERLRDENAE